MLFMPVNTLEFCMVVVGWLLMLAGVPPALPPALVFAFGVPTILLLIAALLGMARQPNLSATQSSQSDAPRGITRSEACGRIATHAGLTARETEVLELLSQGNSLNRVGELLGIAPSSARTYSKIVYQKTGMRSRQEIIDAVAGEMGIKPDGKTLE